LKIFILRDNAEVRKKFDNSLKTTKTNSNKISTKENSSIKGSSQNDDEWESF
jgi:hypothetical protein